MSTFDSEGKFVGDSIDLSEVVGSGGFVTEGRYVAEMVSCSGIAASKSSGKPMVHAIFEISEGDKVGFEISDYYPMGISKPKREGGKPYSWGLSKLKSDLRAVGQPWPEGKRFPTKDGYGDQEEAARILGKAMRGKKLDLAVIKSERKDKDGNPLLDDNGKQRFDYRPRVLGLASRGTGDMESHASEDPLGL